jgi:hypothetical protein
MSAILCARRSWNVQVPSNVACRNNSAPHVQLSGCAGCLYLVSPHPRHQLRHHSRILTRSYNLCLHPPTTPSYYLVSSAAHCTSASSSSSVRLAAPHSHGSGFFPFDGPSPQDSARELIKVRRFSMRSCSTADNRYSAFLTDLSCSPVSIGSVALAELVSPFLRRSWLLFRCTVIQGRSSPSDSLLSLFGVGIIPTWYI